MDRMRVRVLAGVLWFVLIWNTWALASDFVGLPLFIGPMLGALGAAAIAFDFRHRIWPSPSAATAAGTPDPGNPLPLPGGRVVAPGETIGVGRSASPDSAPTPAGIDG